MRLEKSVVYIQEGSKNLNNLAKLSLHATQLRLDTITHSDRQRPHVADAQLSVYAPIHIHPLASQ